MYIQEGKGVTIDLGCLDTNYICCLITAKMINIYVTFIFI